MKRRVRDCKMLWESLAHQWAAEYFLVRMVLHGTKPVENPCSNTPTHSHKQTHLHTHTHTYTDTQKHTYTHIPAEDRNPLEGGFSSVHLILISRSEEHT